ncbi:MAG: hypothetical protein LBS07_05330 [Prevotellaceae bacterium]|jgi:hypothetical protein|nr:hypothetical protein [Prevotellaceae bacterium]
MKSLKVPFLSLLDTATAKEAAKTVSESPLPFEEIGEVNWASSFAYKPGAKFKIARSTDSLFLYYRIEENSVRALYANDQEPVWQDSCVEFFCKLPEQPFYRNFEFNCIGTCLAFAREGRDKNLKPFDANQLRKIERHASLGNQPFDEKHQKTAWELCVKIPFALLDINAEKLPEKILANFYKCGDGTISPHYVSWNPVKTENPDFHRPEFFGALYF